MTKPGIFILGSTGPTGELVTPRLIDSGRHVTVMHRSENRRAEYEHMGARVLTGDAMQSESIAKALRDAAGACSIVLNMLGGNPFDKPENWPDYTGTVNAVDAAIDAGFDAMILVTSIGTGASLEWVPNESFLIPLLKLKTEAETYLRESALNSIILKPGGLGPPGEHLAPVGKTLITENHGVRGLLPREDLAMVICEVIDKIDNNHFGKELYLVADRIEHHAGAPIEYTL